MIAGFAIRCPRLDVSKTGVSQAFGFGSTDGGGKFDIPFDDSIGEALTNSIGAEDLACDLVLEGGALEFNGAGTIITTESCVLHRNRNVGLTQDAFENALRRVVSVDRVLWLRRGLAHDHTDGHVDMVARFVDADTVLCMGSDPGAPNAEVFDEIRETLSNHELRVLELPAPPSIAAVDGTPLPSTYCNFYIANRAVIVPTYDSPSDQQAIDVLASVFPDRMQVGLPARDLLCGGGAFHCTTQPLPAAE